MSSNDNPHSNANPANGEQHDAQPDPAQLAEARFTAYVLGELSDDERAAVEKDLAESEALRRQVSDIQRSVETLTAALAAEPMPQLPAPAREQLAEHSRQSHRENGGLRPVRPRRRRVLRYLVAASLLLCLTGWLMLPHLRPPREVAWQPVATARLRASRIETQHDMSHYKGTAVGVEYPEAQPGTSHQQGDKIVGSVGKKSGRSSMQAEDRRSVRGMLGAYAKKRTSGSQSTKANPTYEAMPSDEFSDVREDLPRLGYANYDHAKSLETSPGHRGPAGEHPRLSFQLEDTRARDSQRHNTESYNRIDENPFLDARQNPLSTFSIDVDTASYANLRRFLNAGSLPPKDAVRIEEMLNYFTYHYSPPTDDKPFAVHAEVAGCPWQPKHRLLRIALKGWEIDLKNRPAGNLVFLIDVSGSMNEPAKLPLLKNALRLLVDKLAENDCVAMVVYAGSSGLVLPSISGLSKETILAALDRLQAGGSTNGGSGIQLAYKVAREQFIQGGANRVILCTDGDFNVGVTDQGSLTRLIEEEAKSGVFLSVLGFGTGNLKDASMEQLADRGNGNYAYIDSLREARKVLVEQLGGTLVTIAKDVKLQLEFNPRQVSAYRLIGYENRLLRAEDFNDDQKDAGEIGAGHTVTALYELVPAGEAGPAAKTDELKYQRVAEPDGAISDELLTLKLRYKQPDGDTSRLMEHAVKDSGASYALATEDYRFATAVAAFGLMLRDSRYQGDLTWDAVRELAEASRGDDEQGYRREMIELVKKAQLLVPKPALRTAP